MGAKPSTTATSESHPHPDDMDVDGGTPGRSTLKDSNFSMSESSNEELDEEKPLHSAHRNNPGRVTDLSESISESPKPIRIGESDVVEETSPKSESPKMIRKALPMMNRLKNINWQKEKSNSTASVFVNNTITNPSTDEVIRCMSSVIYVTLKKNENMPKKTLVLPEIFSEEKFPLDNVPDIKNTPEEIIIYYFISSVFKASRLSAETGVMCMAYLDRLVSNTGFTLHPSNWRRITLGALILASKVWEDASVWNEDFLSDAVPNMTVKDLNNLERHYLNFLKFNVSLKASEYAKYYFDLQAVAKQGEREFGLKPLSEHDIRRLEKRSEELTRENDQDLRKTN